MEHVRAQLNPEDERAYLAKATGLFGIGWGILEGLEAIADNWPSTTLAIRGLQAMYGVGSAGATAYFLNEALWSLGERQAKNTRRWYSQCKSLGLENAAYTK